MATKKRAKATKRRESLSDPSAFVVRHGGYPYDVLVCIGLSDDAVVERLREYEDCEPTPNDLEALTKPDRGGMDAPSNAEGRTILLDGHQTVIRLRRWDGSIKRHGFLTHEIFHAVTMLFELIGMTLSEDSDEAYAYAIEQLTVKILTQLALPPSKRKDEV
jgi:hypothetical protein